MRVKEEILRSAGLAADTALADTSVEDGGVWQTAHFDVPSDTFHERVLLEGQKYRSKFGNQLEVVGFTVLQMSNPLKVEQNERTPGHLRVPPDRTRYRLVAWCTRRPIEITIDLPDNQVEAALRAGAKLK